MSRTATRALAGLGLVGLMCGLLACNPYGDYCKAAMDCEGGNDKDVDACVAEREAESDLAHLWDCDEWYDAYFACAEENSSCENGHYSVHDHSCDVEADDIDACGDF
jgi:hypothetical protein